MRTAWVIKCDKKYFDGLFWGPLAAVLLFKTRRDAENLIQQEIPYDDYMVNADVVKVQIQEVG